MAKHYISEVIEYQDQPRVRLGMMNSHRWRMDPKVLLFSMSRYKFVAKMLAGQAEVLDIGCGDGWGAHIVKPEVGGIRAYDMDPLLVEEAERLRVQEGISFHLHDLSEGPIRPVAPAAYLLDVLEHVDPAQEGDFLGNLAASLEPRGVCIVGIPSRESQAYASRPSRRSHVNCKSGAELKETLAAYFHQVFLFSMNDEVVHTGFYPMAHYLLALCVGIKGAG